MNRVAFPPSGWTVPAGIGRLSTREKFGRLVLTLSIAVSVVGWYVGDQARNASIEHRLDARSDELAVLMADRVAVHEQLLAAAADLVRPDDSGHPAQWSDIVETAEPSRWSSLGGVGYVTAIDGAADGPPHSRVTVLEPVGWMPSVEIGADPWNDPAMRDAMARSRDSGVPSGSAMVPLVSTTGEAGDAGSVVFAAAYDASAGVPTTVAERRAALIGWVFAPVSAGSLVDSISSLVSERSTTVDELETEIYDGVNLVPGALMDSDVAGTSSIVGEPTQRRHSIDVAGRTWTMVTAPTDALSDSVGGVDPLWIVAAALVINFLLFVVLRSLGSLERRARDLAAERTADLAQAKQDLEAKAEQLRLQTDELERSNDELAQFAHAAAHDLQEPLRTMGSYSQLLSTRYADHLDESGQRWLGYISDGANRLSLMIRDVLQYSAVGAEPALLEPVPIVEVLGDAVDRMRSGLEGAEITVEVDSLPTVLADRRQLDRVVQNLLCNAVKYRHPDRPPKLTIAGLNEGDQCRIEVRDNGVGIALEHQQSVFELFSRGGRRHSDADGTGLGLAISRRIIEQANGAMGVESTPGEGSTFWFTLDRTHDNTVDLDDCPLPLRASSSAHPGPISDCETCPTPCATHGDPPGAEPASGSSPVEVKWKVPT